MINEPEKVKGSSKETTEGSGSKESVSILSCK